MNNINKLLAACLLTSSMLFGGTSVVIAAEAPSLGWASEFAVLSAASSVGGAVTCTDSTIDGNVGSSGFPASVVQTRCSITGAVVAPVSTQILTDFNNGYDALAGLACDETLTGTLACALTRSPAARTKLLANSA